jgi:hypothetical protein
MHRTVNKKGLNEQQNIGHGMFLIPELIAVTIGLFLFAGNT